ncbi:hypothetical protein GmHk_02G004912 [Glycine max]|nr:hypothetical protein GmHk_02G004912 [Glycine max]
MTLITIEANASCHFTFKHTPQGDINHIISYYAYFGFAWSDNPVRISQQFFGHDANGKPTRSIFNQNTIVKVHEDVGDFNDDEDITSSEISFYRDVYSEEIFEGEMVSSDKECDSLGDESNPS